MNNAINCQGGANNLPVQRTKTNVGGGNGKPSFPSWAKATLVCLLFVTVAVGTFSLFSLLTSTKQTRAEMIDLAADEDEETVVEQPARTNDDHQYASNDTHVHHGYYGDYYDRPDYVDYADYYNRVGYSEYGHEDFSDYDNDYCDESYEDDDEDFNGYSGGSINQSGNTGHSRNDILNAITNGYHRVGSALAEQGHRINQTINHVNDRVNDYLDQCEARYHELMDELWD